MSDADAFQAIVRYGMFGSVDDELLDATGGTCPVCKAPGELGASFDPERGKVVVLCDAGQCMPSDMLRAWEPQNPRRVTELAAGVHNGRSAAVMAWRLAQAGFAVIPVWRPELCASGQCYNATKPDGDGTCGQQGKHPMIRWKAYQEEPPRLDLVRDWARRFRGANWAIICGKRYGLAVLDVDSAEGLAYLEKHGAVSPVGQYTSTRDGFRRRQYFFAYPATGAKIPPRAHLMTVDGRKLAIDVRADAAYPLLPGSRHHSGAIYEEITPWM